VVHQVLPDHQVLPVQLVQMVFQQDKFIILINLLLLQYLV